MSDGQRERSDAARNRRAILAATEGLLATHRASEISMEQVAAAAGVGKGTVFHRFGNRAGLMYALMVERAHHLEEAVTSGPPPLGAGRGTGTGGGASDRERLLAFLDAVIDVVARNKNLLSELGRAVAAPSPGTDQENTQAEHPVYAFWHGHISSLIAAQRPDIDAETIAHILLGSLHSDAILNQLATQGPNALAASMRTIVCAVLDAPRQEAAAVSTIARTS